MGNMDKSPIYTIMVCTKQEELVYEHIEADGTVVKKPSGFASFGEWEIVGFFHEEESAIEAVKANACDIYETCYEYAVVEEVTPGLYSWKRNCWCFKYDGDLDEYVQIEVPEIVKSLGLIPS